MATVFLAHDLRNNRPVALQVLRPGLTASLRADHHRALPALHGDVDHLSL